MKARPVQTHCDAPAPIGRCSMLARSGQVRHTCTASIEYPFAVARVRAAHAQHRPASDVTHGIAREKKLTVAGLAAVAYFTCSGGPFGLEPLIAAVGPGYAVLLILVSPVLWSMPLALMSVELTTMMPEEGGYYVWVSRAMGRCWGVQEAWWSLWNTIALMALFVVLFVTYLGFFIPALAAPTTMAAVLRWLVAAGVEITGTWVNLRGAKEVGRSALIGATLVAGTFIVAPIRVRSPCR